MINDFLLLDLSVWNSKLEDLERMLEGLVLLDKAMKHPQHFMFSRLGLCVPSLRYLYDPLAELNTKLKSFSLPEHDPEASTSGTTDKKSQQALRSFYIAARSLLKSLLEAQTSAKAD
jgi:hypothetical protein